MLSSALNNLDTISKQNVMSWLKGSFDPTVKKEIEDLLIHSPEKLTDAFFKRLTFGTGGLRGIVGIGTNRINKYTLCMATQGLANYIKHKGEKKDKRVVIGYDSRNHSREFAWECAKVLAGNHIEVLIFPELRPTPIISYACRFYQAQAAIIITASHNPPEYNGYKVYWSDGGQIVLPQDRGIMDEVNKIENMTQVFISPKESPLINEIPKDLDKAYLNDMTQLQQYPHQNKNQGYKLKIIYSSLHGTGSTLVPPLLEKWGFTNLTLVEEQSQPCGNFSTVKTPNPEEREAMSLGIKYLEKNNGDILLATDPDADRVGVVVQHQDSPTFLSGNQIASLCLYHLCESMTQQKTFPRKAAFVKTIVTSELFKKIAEHFNKPCFDVLTGFKYIADKIKHWEKDDSYHFVFGGEESFGYLFGTQVRDKDAVNACALICEIALKALLEGKTLIDKLHDLYAFFGTYREKLYNFNLEESKDGIQKINVIMQSLRESPPKKIAGYSVLKIEDYLSSTQIDLNTNEKSKLDLPSSDAMRLWLDAPMKLTIRPSGTEPKLKFYLESWSDDKVDAINKCEHLIEKVCQEIKQWLSEF